MSTPTPGARLKAQPRRSQPRTPRRIPGRLRCQALCLRNRPAGREPSPFPCPGRHIAARLRTPPGSAGLRPFPETHNALPHSGPAFSGDRPARDHRRPVTSLAGWRSIDGGHRRGHGRDLLTAPLPGGLPATWIPRAQALPRASACGCPEEISMSVRPARHPEQTETTSQIKPGRNTAEPLRVSSSCSRP
jgi:hypothetical protein